MNIEKTNFSFRGNENSSINVLNWTPETSTIKGVIVIVHGMAEYANRYDEFARFLTENNYVVYAHDQRGHGYTLNSRKVGFFGKKNGWELILSDLHKLIKITKEKHPELPTILFGHSMGSLLARTYAIDYGRFIDKLIVCGTAHNPGLLSTIGLALAKTLSFLVKPHTPSKIMTKMTFAGFNKTYKEKRTKFDFLTRDNVIVDKYIQDTLCGFDCSNAFYVDMLTGLKYIHQDKNIQNIPSSLPILLISGKEDPVGDYGKGVEKVFLQLKTNGCKDVNLKLYPNARHELINETNRKEVYKDVLNWIERDKNPI